MLLFLWYWLVRLSAGGKESKLDFEFDASVSVLTIRKPGVNAGEDWTITLK